MNCVARRLSFILVAVMLLAAPLGRAQQAPGRGGAGRGPGAAGTGPINAYAYQDCGPSNAPAVSLVVVTGLVPATIPASTPQPSVKIMLNTGLEQIDLSKPQSIAISPEAGKAGNALALSCPVVGDCVPAQTGTLSIERRAEDGSLTGNYQATWPGAPPRSGRFNAAWRESGKKCG